MIYIGYRIKPIALMNHDGWPGRLSDSRTNLPQMTEGYWRELQTEQNVRFFAGGGPSEGGTGRVTAKSNPPEDTGPPHSFVDVSIIPWTDFYPDDPDKARELTASTRVPGLQVYPADIFFTNPTSSDAVPRAKAEQQTGEQSKMSQRAVERKQQLFLCSDVNTGLPPMIEESFRSLGVSSGKGEAILDSVSAFVSEGDDGTVTGNAALADVGRKHQEEEAVPNAGHISPEGGSEKLFNRIPYCNADEPGWVKLNHPIPEMMNGSEGVTGKGQLVESSCHESEISRGNHHTP